MGRAWSDFDQRFFDEVKADVERGRVRAEFAPDRPPDLPEAPSHADEVLNRLDLYLQTGNRGYLVDCARYAMWQWIEDE